MERISFERIKTGSPATNGMRAGRSEYSILVGGRRVGIIRSLAGSYGIFALTEGEPSRFLCFAWTLAGAKERAKELF